MALFSKDGPEDEVRDAHGRWMQGLIDRGAKPYGTTGITGMSRDQVKAKVRGFLDENLGHTVGPRPVTYSAAIAARLAGTVLGLPVDTQVEAEKHIASATGFVTGKVLAHPAWRRLAARVIVRLRKSLEPDEAEELKGVVSGVMADTRLHPRVSCDDAALAEVARGAYRHCHDRLDALKHAATN
jgi:hypothetical protein